MVHSARQAVWLAKHEVAGRKMYCLVVIEFEPKLTAGRLLGRNALFGRTLDNVGFKSAKGGQ
jgi:hypothetical protein